MRVLNFAVCAFVLALAGCDQVGSDAAKQTSHGPAQRTAATTFYPTTYFAERIASGAVKVTNLCPAGQDPADWMPSREAIAEFQAAGLILTNGAHFESWTSSVALPSSRVVETAAAFKAAWLTFPGVTHNHGSGGTHSHTGTDGHTWLDPQNAILQAAEIRDAFSRKWPESAKDFGGGFDSLKADLTKLDERFRAITPKVKNARVFASHPAYGYIAARYGWSIGSVDLPPDTMPGETAWADIGKQLAGGGLVIVLFEEEPLGAIRDRLQSACGAAAVVFSPCEQPGEGSYIERMNRNLDGFERSLGLGK